MYPNMPITVAKDLVTSGGKTKAGLLALALAKNRLAIPYIEEARTLRYLASKEKKT